MSGDPRGMEADNLEDANASEPFSTPRVSNFTLINSGEPLTQQGALFRRGMKGTIANGIIVDWSVGLDVDSDQTFLNYDNDELEIQSIFLDNDQNFADDGDNPDDGTLGVPAFTAANNLVEGTNSLTGFSFVDGATGLVPGASEDITVYDVTGIGELEATTYVGAVEDADDDWYLGWTVDLDGEVTAAN